jgi:hypothetical protein
MLRSSLAAAAFLLLQVSSMSLAPPAVAQRGETFRPGFGWQAGMRIEASETRVGVLREGAVSDSGRVSTATYTIVVSEHRDGLLIAHEDIRVERARDFPEDLPPIARVNQVVADNLEYWMRLPNLVVTEEGGFVRVDDLEGFRFQVESSIRPIASALSNGDPEVLGLLDELLASVIRDEVIEELAADRWASLVDRWAHTDWEIGQVFGAEIEAPNPLIPGPAIEYTVLAGVTEKLACQAPSGGLMCAVFVMVTHPAESALGQAAQTLADSLGAQLLAAAGSEVPAEYQGEGAAAPLTFQELRLESRVELMADPVSLLPLWLEERETRAGSGIGLGEPFSFFTEEILTTDFSYPEGR